ncbi:hypothetical protein M422DRAFT_22743 [Sphaerobolus stellatus SS14]|nr:hypothetical protein M422DRAFT_22743 [Sphaerobolus stellatus SS14]
MNKRSNPFFPQQAAYPQPPLPPGPPPHQPPAQYDYSAYWAAAQAAQPGQQPQPQWPTQPAAMTVAAGPQIPPNQAQLYANYGYGGRQNFTWQQRPPQQPQQPPQQPRQQPFPIPQAPAAHQPYYPAQPSMPTQMRPFPNPHQQYAAPPNQPYRPTQPMFSQPPPPPQHSPPQLPPAKRPRFEGPQNNLGMAANAGRGGPIATNIGPGPARGGPPTGPSGRGAIRGRGAGPGPSNMGPLRGGAVNVAGRGGGGRPVHGAGGRGGGQMGGHRGGRGWQGHGRRGNAAGGRGRGAGFSHTNHAREGATKANIPDRPAKKEEVRQTLTDFRIVGLEIESLGWKWGTWDIGPSEVEVNESKENESQVDESKLALADGVEEIEFGSAIKKTVEETTTEDTEPLSNKSSTDPSEPVDSTVPDEAPKEASAVSTTTPSSSSSSPPRIRIYFNTPMIFDYAQPKSSVNGTTGVGQRAKRKMSEDAEEEEGPRTRTKLNPEDENGAQSQAKSQEAEKERGSVAPSVDISATASVSGRTEDEGDWLMEAIGRDGDDTTQEVSIGHEDEHAEIPEVDVHDQGMAEVPQVAENVEVPERSEAEDLITESLSLKVDDQSSPKKDDELPTAEVTESENTDVAAPEPIPVVEEDLSIRTDEPTKPVSEQEHHDVPMDTEHDPEPPASPVSVDNSSQPSVSQTLSGGSSLNTTIVSPSNSQIISVLPTTDSQRKKLSANRVSISYASGARRILIDAHIVETMKIWRGQGRIEISLSLEREGDLDFKGLIVEAYSQEKQTYEPLSFQSEDGLLPSWSNIITPSKILMTIYLDKEKPMTEPRWVKTGDLMEWLRNTFGIFWPSGEDGWEKRIEVVDPDPPPTIYTVLENWASSSLVGLEAERQRFVKTHMSERDNLLEILLRLVRGERATPISFSGSNSSSNLHLTGPLLTALSSNAPHAAQQTHLTLAIVAMVRMAEGFAERTMASGEAKKEVDERVGEIIRCLPQHLLYKSLDGIFREWKDTKKRGGRG